MKRVLSMLVENKPGALARVVGLFHQRGYNIESLNVAPVDDGSYSRLTVATRGTESAVEQIMKQINKLIDIIKVADLTETQISTIRDSLESDDYKLEGDLKRLISLNIKRLVDINSVRGRRHIKGLPVRGQRTRTNNRTSRRLGLFTRRK